MECSTELYIFLLMTDLNISQDNHEISADPEDLQFLLVKIEKAIENMKRGNSPGVDNAPAELIKVAEKK